jgi:hypothetical protein
MIFVTEPYRFFVAGPYCPRNCGEHDYARIAQRNVDKAIEIGNALNDFGHFAFVPHLQHYMHIHHSCTRDRGMWYNEFDITFLEDWANAFFYIGPSPGSIEELTVAKRLMYPVFGRLIDVPMVKR